MATGSDEAIAEKTASSSRLGFWAACGLIFTGCIAANLVSFGIRSSGRGGTDGVLAAGFPVEFWRFHGFSGYDTWDPVGFFANCVFAVVASWWGAARLAGIPRASLGVQFDVRALGVGTMLVAVFLALRGWSPEAFRSVAEFLFVFGPLLALLISWALWRSAPGRARGGALVVITAYLAAATSYAATTIEHVDIVLLQTCAYWSAQLWLIVVCWLLFPAMKQVSGSS